MDEKPEKFTMSDGLPHQGMLMRGTTVFKAQKHKGVEITYQEVDLEEYDKRVSDLAAKIAKMPGVDLMAVLKDALYDLPLNRLANVEKKIEEELKKPKPEIVTTPEKTYRGTCVQLTVGGKNLVELRH